MHFLSVTSLKKRDKVIRPDPQEEGTGPSLSAFCRSGESSPLALGLTAALPGRQPSTSAGKGPAGQRGKVTCPRSPSQSSHETPSSKALRWLSREIGNNFWAPTGSFQRPPLVSGGTPRISPPPKYSKKGNFIPAYLPPPHFLSSSYSPEDGEDGAATMSVFLSTLSRGKVD